MPENKHLRIIVLIFYCFVVLLALFITFRYALRMIAPFLVALVLAILIERPVSFSQKHLHLPRALASGIWTLLVFLLSLAAVWFICTKIFTQVRDLLALLPSPEKLFAWTDRLIHTLPQSIQETVHQLDVPSLFPSEQLFLHAGKVALGLPSLLFSLLTALFATFFLSSEKNVLLDLLGKKAQRICATARRMGIELAGCYLRAAALLFLLTFSLLAVGLSLLRIRYALGLAFLTALLDAVPIFGTGAVLLPMAVLRLISGDFVTSLGLILLYLVILALRSIAEPKILGEQIGLPPFFTLFFLYVGVRVFGLLGLLLPPLAAIGFRIYKNRGKATV
ncbi:MAG: AI-2E family transporter [Oscillospiraceae bacterium]|nr:AI-2E family transporter [Oscillospiraceae bacterium]